MLTFVHAELQAEESWKQQPQNRPSAIRTMLPQSTKRYLILAYKAEFDQVLYPLPLCAED